METVRDRDKNSPNYEKPVRKCRSCSYVEEVAKTEAGGRGQEKSPPPRITDEDAVKAAKTGQVGGVAPRQEDLGSVFREAAQEGRTLKPSVREMSEVIAPSEEEDRGAKGGSSAGPVADNQPAEAEGEAEGYEVSEEALVADAAAADRSKTAAMDFLGD